MKTTKLDGPAVVAFRHPDAPQDEKRTLYVERVETTEGMALCSHWQLERRFSDAIAATKDPPKPAAEARPDVVGGEGSDLWTPPPGGSNGADAA